MKTALFVMVPHLSHYYPTFGLARALQSRGFRIVYTVAPGFGPVVQREGFECAQMEYDDEFVIRSVQAAAALFLKNLLDPAFRRQCYRAFRSSVMRMEDIVRATAPDLVLLDDTLGHYYPALPAGTRVVQLSTKLSPRKRSGIPPLNFFRRPQGGLPGRWLAEAEWLGHLGKREGKRWLEHLIFLGWSSDAFRARYTAAKGLNREKITRKEMSFYDGISGVPSVVLAPAELEFPQHQLQPDEYYVHFPALRDEAHLCSPAYEQVLERITAQKREGRAKIVYVALGTLSHGNYQRAGRLLKTIIETLGQRDDLAAVVATGGIRLEGIDVKPHIHLLPVVPQLQLLTHCDLVITHGGLGTIKECLQAAVPMLVYPLNEAVDQPGNSARIAARGWGARGRTGDSPARIQKQIAGALQQLPAYREKCRQAQLALRRARPEQAVDELLGDLGLFTFNSAECLYNVSP